MNAFVELNQRKQRNRRAARENLLAVKLAIGIISQMEGKKPEFIDVDAEEYDGAVREIKIFTKGDVQLNPFIIDGVELRRDPPLPQPAAQ